VNIVEIATSGLVCAIPLVGATNPGLVKFSPDGRYVVENVGGPRFIDTQAFTTVAALPNLPINDLVFLRDGRRAYVALGTGGVAILDISHLR